MNKEPLNIVSGWTRQIDSGQQPSGKDLQEHLSSVHDNNAGFTEEIAWNCRDINGKNSYELLADIIDKNYHSHVLDLACGSGVLLDLCYKRYGSELELTGVDMNDAELQLARKRLSHNDIKLYHGLAQELNFISDSSFDVILCHWALTLMDPVVPVLNTAKRVLKKNGIFAAIIDGDYNTAPGYIDIHNIIYKYVHIEYPNYGEIELGDPRVRTVSGIHELASKVFLDPNIIIKPLLLSFKETPYILAREVAGFFYSSFILSVEGHKQMLIELENYFSLQLKESLSCFTMPVRLISIRKK